MKENKKGAASIRRGAGLLLRTAWQSRRSVLLLCVVLAVLSAGQTTVQLLVAPVILDRVERAAPLPELLAAIGLFSAALFLLAALHAYTENAAQLPRIDLRTGKLLRRCNEKFARTSFPNLYDPSFLDLTNKAQDALKSNSSAAEETWVTLTALLTNLIGLLVYLALLSGLHPALLLLVAATTAAGFFVNRRIDGWSYRHREEGMKASHQIGYIQGLRTDRRAAKDIFLFGLQPWLLQVRRDGLRLFRDFQRKCAGRGLIADGTALLLDLLRNGAAYAYLLGLALGEGMSAAEFLLYFTAVSGFTQWVTGILDEVGKLHRESLELCSIQDYLEWPEPFRFSGGEPLPVKPDDPCELRLDGVRYRYAGADHDALCRTNLTIRPGEKLAVVGLNGAGKTTLVRLLCGLLDPTEGRVLFNGQDIRRFNRQDYYKLFSAVFQDFSVLDGTVTENVAQTAKDADEDRVRLCLRRAGLETLEQSLPQGLHTHLGRSVYEDGTELSGGQTQRLMLARALYKDGPILALDEPTAALDPVAEDELYHKYSEMTQGRTSLFISHRLASTRFCDRILFLRDGRIAEEGTHEELLAKNGGYAELFRVQSRYYKEGGDRDEA